MNNIWLIYYVNHYQDKPIHQNLIQSSLQREWSLYNLIEKVAAASTAAISQKRKRSVSSEEGSSARAPGPSTRGGQGSHIRNVSNRGGTAVVPAPQPRGSYRAANSASSMHSLQSWNPPRGRGQHQGRGEARGRGFPAERGRGNFRGGQPRRGWGRPWSRW